MKFSNESTWVKLEEIKTDGNEKGVVSNRKSLHEHVHVCVRESVCVCSIEPLL